MPRVLPGLIVTFVAFVLLAAVLPASAAPALQTTDTPTPTVTPTVTPTPAYVTSYTLDSGNTLIVERHWTFGELAIFLAVLGLIALEGLRWMYELTHVTEVVITRKEVE